MACMLAAPKELLETRIRALLGALWHCFWLPNVQ